MIYTVNMKKISLYLFAALGVFLLNTVTVMADPGGSDPLPCDPDDPNCPLDTWVIVLVAVALVTAVVHLHRKQKALQV
jgi:hypothetical protein